MMRASLLAIEMSANSPHTRPAPTAGARGKVVDDIADHVEVATGRERLAGPGQDGGGDPGVGVDVAPDFDQLAMHGCIRGVEPARIVHGDTQHARVRAIELQTLIAEIAISQSGVPFYDPGLATRTALRIKESRRIGSRPSAWNWRRFGISVRSAEAPVRCSAVFTWRSRWPVRPAVFRRDAWLSTDRFRRAGIRAPSRRAGPPP